MSKESENRWRLRALEAEDRVRDLEHGIAEIVYALTQKQPQPRNASVTYVAGYARAMDDMRQIVVAIATEHRKVPPKSFGRQVRELADQLGFELEPWQVEFIKNIKEIEQ